MTSGARKAGHGKWLGALLAAVLASLATVAGASVVVLEPPANSVAMQTAEQTFLNEFTSDSTNPRLMTLDWSRLSAPERLARLNKDVTLVVTFGVDAATEVLHTLPEHKVMVLFARRADLERLRAKWPGRLTGITLDQPYRRLFALARVLSPDGHAGILLGPETAPWLSADLERAAYTAERPLNLLRLRPGDSPLRLFERLLLGSSVVLAVPDPAAYTNQSLQNQMLTAFRHRVPVVGHSEQMADAGALVALYSDPVRLGRQGARLAKQALSGMPPVEDPEDFALVVNYQVARNLGLAQASEGVLRDALVRADREYLDRSPREPRRTP